jgi:hypothetical protein
MKTFGVTATDVSSLFAVVFFGVEPHLKIIKQLGSSSGEDWDFRINWYAFLERFCGGFDTTASQVGYATTAQTSSTSN